MSGFVPLNAGYCGLYRSFRAQNKSGRLSPADPGIISRGVTDLYPSLGHTHPVTRAIEKHHAKLSFDLNHFRSISHLRYYIYHTTVVARGVADLYP